MAGGIRGITVKIGGDTTELGRALKDASSQSTALQKELKGVNTLLKMDPSNVTLLKQKQELLTQSIEQTKNKLTSLKEVLAKVDSGEIEMTEEEYRNLQREIVNTEQKLKSLTNQQKEFGSVGAQQIAQVGEKLKSAGDKVTSAGEKMLPVTGIIGAIGAVAIKTTADFDSSMSNVQAISGATTDELELLRAKAREMGSETKFSASECADAMGYMAMAGWKTEDMLYGLDGVLALASASGTDLARTSDIVTDSLTGFGKGADEAGRLADIMASASSNANTNVELMGETFKYVAPLAGAMGLTMEDVSIATGLMANAGIKGSQAGTSLKNILTNMANPTESMAIAMDKLGLSLDDGEGNMKSLKEIMDDMRAGFGELMISEEEYNNTLNELNAGLENGTLTEKQYDKALEDLMRSAYGAEGAEKARYASMLAGKEGMAGMLSIVNASAEDYDKLTDAIYNSSGSAENMADIMNDNLNGQFTILKSQLEELAISFGEILMPIIRDIVSAVQGFVDKLNSMDEGQRKVIITILAVVASIGPLLIVIGKLLSTIGTIMTWAPKIKTAITAINGALMANPIAIVIVALVALVAGLIYAYNHCEKFREIVDKAFAKVKEIVSKVIDALVKFFTETVPNAINSMIEYFKAIPDKVKNAISSLVEKVSTTFTNVKNKAVSIVTTLINSVVNFFVSLPGKIASAIAGAITVVGSWGTNMLNTAKSKIASVVSGIIGGFASLPGQMVNIGKNIIQGIISGMTSMVSNLYSSIKNSLSGLVNKAKSALGIHSPSRVFADVIGKQIPAGVAKGIDDNTDIAEDAVDDMASSLLDTELNGSTLNRKLNATFSAGATSGINGPQLMSTLADIYNRLDSLKVVLDSGELVGGIIDHVDSALNDKNDRVVRGW